MNLCAVQCTGLYCWPCSDGTPADYMVRTDYCTFPACAECCISITNTLRSDGIQ